MRNKMPQETKKERVERVIKEEYPKMVAIAKIEVLFNQILELLPLADSPSLREALIEEIAAA
ncbi:MAG: hypothetical protein Q8M39_05200 [Sulfuricurvum sp.]|nr:hypothetical protein [Sulfuricurvum sp.]